MVEFYTTALITRTHPVIQPRLARFTLILLG
jgi:hypothetical protein